MTENYQTYVSFIERMRNLMLAGKFESPEADHEREAIEGVWDTLSDEDQSKLRMMSLGLPRSPQFRVGDVVQLKSGGPAMTVTAHADRADPVRQAALAQLPDSAEIRLDVVSVCYGDGDRVVWGFFPPACLKPYEPPPKPTRFWNFDANNPLSRERIQQAAMKCEDAFNVLVPNHDGKEGPVIEQKNSIKISAATSPEQLYRGRGSVSPPSTLEKMPVEIQTPCPACDGEGSRMVQMAIETMTRLGGHRESGQQWGKSVTYYKDAEGREIGMKTIGGPCMACGGSKVMKADEPHKVSSDERKKNFSALMNEY